MKARKHAILRRLMLWLMTLTMLLSICGGPVYAEGAGGIILDGTVVEGTGTPGTLTPPDFSYENGNVILHKQAERIGPEEWKVSVKVTVGPTAVEKRKMEVVVLLDTSSSMRTNTAHDHTEECDDLTCTVHTEHTDSCYGDELVCTLPAHTHDDDCCSIPEHEHIESTDGCYQTRCTIHNSNNAHTNAGCVRIRGTWYRLTCTQDEHTHSASCDSLCNDGLVQHAHSFANGCYELECELPLQTSHTHSLGCYHCPYYGTKANGTDDEYLRNGDATRMAVAVTAAERLIASLPEEAAVTRLAFDARGNDLMSYGSYYDAVTHTGTYLYTAINNVLSGNYFDFQDKSSKKVFIILNDGGANDSYSTAVQNLINSFKDPTGINGTIFTVGFGEADGNLPSIAGNGGTYMMATNADQLIDAFEDMSQTLTAMLEDPMGTSVGFISGSISEIQNTSGVISNNGDIIYWHPNEDGTDTISNSVIWYTYKVKLNDEANKNVGVHSEVPLNDPTSFMYGIENGEQTKMQSAAFPIPEATYAYSSIQTTWQATDADGRTFTISQSDLAALNPDIASNPEAVEKVISDYSSAAYIPAFTQQYQFNPPVIPIEGSNDYYRYVGTTVTADGQVLAGVTDVDATKPVAYQVVHEYELVEAHEVYIDINKKMVGRDFASGDDFTFTMTTNDPDAPLPVDPETGEVNTSVTISPTSGNVFNFSFGKMTFTKAGVYTYTLKELPGNQDNMIYDTAERTMVVTVTDKGGVLTATCEITGAGLNFTNSLGTGSLKIEKTTVTSHLKEHQKTLFPFLVSVTNVSNRPISGAYTLVNPDDGTTSTVNFTNGYATVSLKAGQSVVIEGLPDGATYTVTEGNVGGFTPTATGSTGAIFAHQQATASFSNTYAASGRYQFFGTKMVQDMTLAVDQFTFFVTDEDDKVVARGTNTSDGSIFFDTLEFTHKDVGQKTYHIAETIGNQEGVIYDRTVYTVTLTIADNGDGTLSIADDLDGSKITFLNKYVTNQLTISKAVAGNMANRYKEFSFTLTARRELAGQTVNVSYDGGLTFQEIALDGNGESTFTLAHGDNIIFYPIEGTYTVTETDNGSYTTTYSLNGAAAAGGTSVTSTIPNNGSSSVRFTNTYNVGVPTGVSTPVAVALVGIAMAMALLAIVYAGRRWKFLEE